MSITGTHVSPAIAQKTDVRGHAIAIGIAAAIHGLIVLIVLTTHDLGGSGGGDDSKSNPFKDSTVIEATLVKKGVPKVRAKAPVTKTEPTIPTAATAPTNPATAPTTAITKNPNAVTKLDPALTGPSNSLASAQERARLLAEASANGDPTAQEGDINGSEWGTSTTAKGDPYLAELVGRVQANWEVPPALISEEELLTLKVIACFKVDAEGKITDFRIDRASRSSRFDKTFEQAVENTKEVGPPRGEYKKTIMEDGVCLRFDKKPEGGE